MPEIFAADRVDRFFGPRPKGQFRRFAKRERFLERALRLTFGDIRGKPALGMAPPFLTTTDVSLSAALRAHPFTLPLAAVAARRVASGQSGPLS